VDLYMQSLTLHIVVLNHRDNFALFYFIKLLEISLGQGRQTTDTGTKSGIL
jgi:hypothetical protein